MGGVVSLQYQCATGALQGGRSGSNSRAILRHLSQFSHPRPYSQRTNSIDGISSQPRETSADALPHAPPPPAPVRPERSSNPSLPSAYRTRAVSAEAPLKSRPGRSRQRATISARRSRAGFPFCRNRTAYARLVSFDANVERLPLLLASSVPAGRASAAAAATAGSASSRTGGALLSGGAHQPR